MIDEVRRPKSKIATRKPNQDTDPTTHNPTPKPVICSNPRNTGKPKSHTPTTHTTTTTITGPNPKSHHENRIRPGRGRPRPITTTDSTPKTAEHQ